MSCPIFKVITAIFVFFFTLISHAIKLDQYVESYLSIDEQVAVSQSELRSAKNRLTEAKALVFPKVNLNYSKLDQTLPVGIPDFYVNNRAELSVSQPLFWEVESGRVLH